MTQQYCKPGARAGQIVSLCLLMFAIGGGLNVSLALAQPESAQQPYLLRSGASDALRGLRLGVWGTVGAEVANPGDSEVNLLVSSFFQSLPNVQFATEIWLPANSRRKLEQVVRPDGQVSASANSLEITTLLLDRSGARELSLERAPGLLALDQRRPNVVVVDSGQTMQVGELVSALLGGDRRDGRVTNLRRTAMPTRLAGWELADAVVLADPELDPSPQQLTALRQWLVAGGRLWVMADRVDWQVARQLLGDDWPFERVDQTPLTTLKIEGSRESADLTFEQPVTMARVIASDVTVLNEVNGWPATMTRSVGQGTLIVTTLGTRAWIAAGTEHQSPALQIGRLINSRYPDPVLGGGHLEQFVRDQIGYHIISRVPVVVALSLFVAVLIGAGIWLGRRDRLEKAGWIGGITAVVMMGLVLGLGVMHRTRTPLTIASTQFVQVVPTQQVGAVSGILSVYSPAADSGPLSATMGGVVWPDRTGQQNELLRMVWRDVDRWAWDNLRLPAGAVRTTELQHVVSFDQPVHARAGFNDQGLVIDLSPGPFESLGDMVVAGRNGALTVRDGGANRLMAQADDVLPPRVFLSGQMSDLRRRRQAVYDNLLVTLRSSTTQQDVLEAGPVLLGWGRPADLGFALPQEGVAHRESALVSLPLEFVRPQAGQQVLVPSPVIPFSLVRSPRGSAVATIYSDQTGEWVGPLTNGMTITVQFALPQAVVPLSPQRMELAVDVRAPGRQLEVLDPYTNRVLHQIAEPGGQAFVNLAQWDVFAPDERGHVLVTLRVSDSPDFQNVPTWMISGLRLEVRGTHQPG